MKLSINTRIFSRRREYQTREFEDEKEKWKRDGKTRSSHRGRTSRKTKQLYVLAPTLSFRNAMSRCGVSELKAKYFAWCHMTRVGSHTKEYLALSSKIINLTTRIFCHILFVILLGSRTLMLLTLRLNIYYTYIERL